MVNLSQPMDEFLLKHPTIKALPENSTRVLRMTGERDCDINQLLKLISQDAALAASIMKAVNSAYYALQKKVTRLDHAVNFMGLRAVKEIAVSSCFFGLCRPVSFGEYTGRDFWDHCVGVAIAARELAIHSNALDPEEAFLAGMLQDLALLLVLQSEPELGKALIGKSQTGDKAFTAYEHDIFGFNHCEIGERIATNWGMAPQLIAAIRWHHQHELAPAQYRSLIDHLYVADTLCCNASIGVPLTCKNQQISDEMLDTVNLTREITETVSGKLPILLRLHLG